MFERRPFTAGDLLARDGEPPDSVLVVTAGELELRDGARTPVRRLGPGAVLGEYGIFPGAAMPGTATALTAGSALALDHQRFERFLLAFPETTLALLRQTVERLAGDGHP